MFVNLPRTASSIVWLHSIEKHTHWHLKLSKCLRFPAFRYFAWHSISLYVCLQRETDAGDMDLNQLRISGSKLKIMHQSMPASIRHVITECLLVCLLNLAVLWILKLCPGKWLNDQWWAEGDCKKVNHASNRNDSVQCFHIVEWILLETTDGRRGNQV